MTQVPQIKILIVDDDRQTVESLEKFLQQFRFLSRSVTHSQDVFPLLASESIDLVLLNINMVEIDALALLDQLKQSDHYSKIPVIMITENPREMVLSQCYEKGAADFVTKPIRDVILKARIKAALTTANYEKELERTVEEKTIALQKAKEELEQEIADRDLMEKERAQLVTAIEQAEESVIITNKKGIIEYVNPYFEKLTGYTLKEATGQTPNMLKSDKHSRLFYQEMWNTILNGKVWSGQITNRKKDGTLYVEDTNISPVFGNRGEITHFIAVKKDITRRLALETQLRHAQKMKAVGILAGGIAHDFNNILFVMLGNAELLQNCFEEGAKEKEYIEDILHSGYRAKKVISQLLHFSTVRDTMREPVQMLDVIEESLRMARVMLPANIEIYTNFPASCPLVLASIDQINQVFLNLYMNAKEAMLETGGVLAVIIELVEFTAPPADIYGIDTGSYLKITIRDNGKGIPPEVKEFVFDPFFTTKGVGGTDIGPSKEGTGLGLTEVYNIIQNHNGGIAVESHLVDSTEHLKGTAFHLYLPTVSGEIQESHRPTKVFKEIKNSYPSSPKEHHILIAEDEPQLAKLYQVGLEDYQVTLCYDGQEALNTFCKNPTQFDLVLTDQEMPKLIGTKLSEELLKIRPDLPIILTTGFSEQVSEKNYQDFGIRKFLLKPIELENLIQSIQEILTYESCQTNHQSC